MHYMKKIAAAFAAANYMNCYVESMNVALDAVQC